MAGEKNNKETEFNSSLATLIRIDEIIRELHQIAMNGRGFDYLKALDRLYIEAQNKMNKVELGRAAELQELLYNLRLKWNRELGMKWRGQKLNANFVMGWDEINHAAREYEIFIMRSMDSHGMLMRDAKKGLEKFRGM